MYPPTLGARIMRRAITVTGTVQGVGFRPFVHGLANELGLGGFVRNWAGGALIEIEGDRAVLDRFIGTLRTGAPPPARIEALQTVPCAPCGEDGFRIERSDSQTRGRVVVPADLATCDACVGELFDPSDRRHRYPFITCAHCGPRLTIVTATPYDRERTTMAAFTMCEACRAEYEDPRDRRFHAQSIGCPACGPRLRAFAGDGVPVETEAALALARRALNEGGIIAVKGIGGYHLACDAGNEAAVVELRRRKARDAKPFAVMVPDLAAAEALCELSSGERGALGTASRPIVLLRRRPGIPVAEAVAPDMAALGLMLPYAPVHHLLLHDTRGRALVMTSANPSDEPIVHDDAEARARLAGIADVIVAHDRPIRLRCDDSVVRVVTGTTLPVRRGRGHTPAHLRLPVPLARATLALGGHLKAAVAAGDGDEAAVSHHLGDLDGYEAYRAYVAAIAHYEALLSIAPTRLVHDMHPDYASTRYAVERARTTGVALLAVQHHHAHMASCMAEHGLVAPVIGVCFDGAGWGPDGTVWGGEFLAGDARAFRRMAHLRPVPMPGGDAAMREPWRMAIAHLREAGEPLDGLPVGREHAGVRTIETMIDRAINTPRTSSMGRLFDAVAAMVGLGERMSYEGQAAMRLEALATDTPHAGAYPCALERQADRLVVDPRPLIRAVAADVREGVAAATVARRFHTSAVDLVDAVCRRVREATGIETVVLSGGVFLNALLAHEVPDRLARSGFRVHRPRVMPPNDGGLCLGQLFVAAAHDAAAGGVR